jgi:hypothetical protein
LAGRSTRPVPIWQASGIDGVTLDPEGERQGPRIAGSDDPGGHREGPELFEGDTVGLPQDGVHVEVVGMTGKLWKRVEEELVCLLVAVERPVDAEEELVADQLEHERLIGTAVVGHMVSEG